MQLTVGVSNWQVSLFFCCIGLFFGSPLKRLCDLVFSFRIRWRKSVEQPLRQAELVKTKTNHRRWKIQHPKRCWQLVENPPLFSNKKTRGNNQHFSYGFAKVCFVIRFDRVKKTFSRMKKRTLYENLAKQNERKTVSVSETYLNHYNFARFFFFKYDSVAHVRMGNAEPTDEKRDEFFFFHI